MPHPSEMVHGAREAQDARVGKIFAARGQLQLLLMNRWSDGDDDKALAWSHAYRCAFRAVFPPHTEPGEQKFLVLEKMDVFSRSGAAEGEQILKDVQNMLDQYLREHPEMRVDVAN